MGFAEGFNAGYGAITQGFMAGVKLSESIKEQRRKDQEEMDKIAKANNAVLASLGKSLQDKERNLSKFDQDIAKSINDQSLDGYNASVRGYNNALSTNATDLVENFANIANNPTATKMIDAHGTKYQPKQELVSTKLKVSGSENEYKEVVVEKNIADNKDFSNMYRVTKDGMIVGLQRDVETKNYSEKPNPVETSIRNFKEFLQVDGGKPSAYTKTNFNNYTDSEKEILRKAGYKEGDEIQNTVAANILKPDNSANSTSVKISSLPETVQKKMKEDGYNIDEVVTKAVADSYGKKSQDGKDSKKVLISELPKTVQEKMIKDGYSLEESVTVNVANSYGVKDKGTKDKETIADISIRQYNKYKENGGTLDYKAWESNIVETAKSQSEANIIKNTLNFGKKFSDSEYDLDGALEQETLFLGTRANNTKIQDRSDKFESSIVLEKSSEDLYNELKADVDAGIYKSGLLQTTKQKIAEYTGKGKFTELLGLSGEEMASRLGLDTKMGDAVAKYVKLISGAAATDAERATLMNIMFGSEYKDENVRLEKFDAFISKMKNDNKREAEGLLKYRPYTAGEYLHGNKKKKKSKSTSFNLSKSDIDRILIEQFGER